MKVVNLWHNQSGFHRATSLESMKIFTSPPNSLKRFLGISESEKIRLLFIGQELFFRQAALEGNFADLDSQFCGYTHGSPPELALRCIEEFDPHLVIVFRPEMCRELERALTNRFAIGYFTEPLPKNSGFTSADLENRLAFLRTSGLENSRVYNLFLGYNPDTSNTLNSIFPIWKYVPIPVSDSIFNSEDFEPQDVDVHKGVFVGRVTPYRLTFLNPLKHFYNWTVIDSAHDLQITNFPLALNLHNEAYSNFENRIFLHMALGQLVLSEVLFPKLDLVNGFSHIEFTSPDELLEVIHAVEKNPEYFVQIRKNGYSHAKRYSASKIWTEILVDLDLLSECI